MTKSTTVSREGEVLTSSVQMWEDAIHAVISRMSVDLRHQDVMQTQSVGDQAFSGHIEYGDLAGTRVCRMTVTPHRFQRALRQDAATAANPLILVLQVRNSSYFEQCGRSGVLSPSDWCVLDTRWPFKWNSLAGNEQIIVRIGRPSDADLGDLVARGMARRCDGKIGVGRVLHAMVGEGFGQMHRLASYSAMGLANAIVATMWNGLREQLELPAAHQPRDIQCTRIKAWIDTRLSDADLSVEAIAHGCGMSPRSVHRAFATDPAGSVSNYIWQRRVMQCAMVLRSPAEATRSITDVALSWGFSNASHFSRVFKTHLGMSPREFKANASHRLCKSWREAS
ncbi:helix-turn-helix domain-containing protein [Variovorax ginsengisoli]|uniref:AraC-like DNA-binding protein n=1 Tax=Variovorax ginsengisoli TaxID=363844 RepID=A0ABT9S968_9BURK|nr:helix-turn-helix domain-containing protein [Variovorax ginsengisoli]MDP9900896.1 AraC-like DNA-binding protein [Variovorax ginsengisoli]